MKKRCILGGLASAVLIAGVLVPNYAFADIDDIPEGSTVRRKTTTYYHTTIKYDGKLVDVNNSVIDTYTNTSEEYDANYGDLTAEIENEDQAFVTWAGEATTQTSRIGGVTDYYFDAHDEIVSVTAANQETLCNGVEGECNINDVVIHTILDKHQTYTITATRKKNIISVIDLDFEAPAAGETNTVTENEVICIGNTLSCDEDSVTPTVSTSTPKVTIRKAIWQVKGEDGLFNRFEGTFEEGEEYYLFVEIAPNEGESVALDPQANIKINGEEVDDGSVTALNAIVRYKFTIQPNNPDTFDGIHVVFGVLSTSTLAGSALFLSKAKRR